MLAVGNPIFRLIVVRNIPVHIAHTVDRAIAMRHRNHGSSTNPVSVTTKPARHPLGEYLTAQP